MYMYTRKKSRMCNISLVGEWAYCKLFIYTYGILVERMTYYWEGLVGSFSEATALIGNFLSFAGSFRYGSHFSNVKNMKIAIK